MKKVEARKPERVYLATLKGDILNKATVFIKDFTGKKQHRYG